MTRPVLLILFLLATMTGAGAASARAEAPQPDPHQQLDQILHRPPFQAWRDREALTLPGENVDVPEAFTDWLRRVGRAIGDFLDRLFRSNRRSSSAGTSGGDFFPVFLRFIAWIALAGALIAVAIVLARMLAKSPTHVATARVLSRHQVRQALESGDALALDSSEWLDEAHRLASEQNFRAVYRALYLALLAGLHTLGKIEHSRNRTNWTYVRYYRGPAEERDTFAELTELFDRVWYGRKDADGQDLDHLRTRVAALTQAGGRH